MAESAKSRTTIFLTGPVKKIESELAELPGEWIPVNYWHHVIKDEACLTVQLVPAALMRQAQLMQQMQPNHRRM